MNVDVLVKEMFEIIDTLSEQDVSSLSGDTLSRLAVKLASYKASLGSSVAESKKIVLDAEADYKLARAEGYKKLRDDGVGSTDSDEMKHISAHDALSALNEARHKANLIVQLSMDCHDLIDAIKSRLIHLQTEKGEGNVH